MTFERFPEGPRILTPRQVEAKMMIQGVSNFETNRLQAHIYKATGYKLTAFKL